MKFCRTYLPLTFLVLIMSPGFGGEDGYKIPPKALANLIDAPRSPVPALSPDRSTLVLLHRRMLPPLQEVAREEIRLGGIRLNPANHGPARARGFERMSIMSLADGREWPVEGLPAALILDTSWSPDSRHVAFSLAFTDRVELWLVSAQDRRARRLVGEPLNATLKSDPFRWLDGGKALCYLALPADKGAPPKAPVLPTGPNIQIAAGVETTVRTYQDLLANPYDEALFSYYLTSRLMVSDLQGKTTQLSEPDLFTSMNPSPDSRYLLVSRLQEPYSYLVPYYRFPRQTEVLDRRGKRVYLAAETPLVENMPKGFDSTYVGRRAMDWRPDTAATLYWTEAQDGGDGAAAVPVREHVHMLAAPFTQEPTLLAKLGLRYRGIIWGDGTIALIRERMWGTRQTRTWIIQPDETGEKKLLFERSMEDRYSDPGTPMMVRNTYGERVMAQSRDGSLFFSGLGASPAGNVPFVDKRNLQGETTRIWHSEAPYYETAMALLDTEGTRFLLRRESKQEPSNMYIKDLERQSLSALTHREHPNPELAGITKEVIRYQRNDGVNLSGTLYLPSGYTSEDGPLPTLLWAYPVEFKSSDAAGQMKGSPYSFTSLSYWGPLPYLAMGYAVLDNPTMPIVGEGEAEPNDLFRAQLIASASAAVDAVVARGVTDRNRVAVGGHSYGAFMVANLLAHSDLFRAGIARSGAYNRTLTPFGFQSEQRTFWDAGAVYASMSPFFHAEKIDEPILFIHGEADNNSGTYPLQSKRMFQAVKGLGGTARLVMLPHESHGYRARESMLHVLWEQLEWLDRYVKNATPRDPS